MENLKILINTCFENLILQYPPSIYITKLPDGNLTYTGPGIQVMDYVAKGLKIRY